MVEEDEDKTTFFAGEGVYCYRKMPFSLKNARATYQRLLDKVFNDQIGINLEAYIDDMVIKSTSEEDMLTDIKETFQRFRSINMKLNPKKCSFGVEEGLFLGHIITKQGIRANPSKVKAITDTEQPKTLKDIHSLNGKLAALSRFMSKGAERKHKRNFICEKGRRTCYHLLRKQSPTGSRAQLPCTGKTHNSIGTRSEKAAKIFSGTYDSDPNQLALTKLKNSGRVAKWAIKLGEHDIVFRARGDSNKETPKDFLIKAPPEDNRKEVGRKTNTKLEETKPSCEWKLYTDGASSFDGLGAGLMLIDPEGKEYTYALRFEFETTNNEADYEALLVGLRIAQEMEIVNLAIFVDSKLLVNQIKGIYAAKQPAIREYLQSTKETLRRFRSYIIEHIRRNQNKKADALSKLASMTFEHLTKEVLVEVLARRKIKIKAPQYKLIRVSLYKKSFYTPWLRCIASPKTDDVIKEIHEGSCGFNTEPCSMVVRITKQGYYWPSMHRNVARIIQDCEKCKEQSVVRKRAKIEAIAAGNAWTFSH
ncbi:reverse transcriptase domain-containing protein [Tanacetum coccineum]|uniref:Reverse transcriptase domain-containing protein n=1 Tax=Tanacetum coccineum TaxID=301880 RepID=A0ABQ5F8M0_9ASTR